MTAVQALLAFSVAGAFGIAGVAGLLGPWWALIAACVWVTTMTVLFYDPQKRRELQIRRGGFRVPE